MLDSSPTTPQPSISYIRPYSVNASNQWEIRAERKNMQSVIRGAYGKNNADIFYLRAIYYYYFNGSNYLTLCGRPEEGYGQSISGTS